MMKKILVADDSVTIQKVIALTFADEPFEVKSVGTGAEALDMMSGWAPDILLADVIMPQMNGYELCRAVKEQQATASIPVLLLAGTFEAFDEEEAKSVGADGYITKPFESGELIEKVNALVGNKAPAKPVQEPSVEGVQGAAPGIAPPPMEPPQTGTAEPDTLQAEPPAAAPPQTEAPFIPSFDVGEVDQGVEATGEPSHGAVSGGITDEPDIWDILSDTETGTPEPDGGITDAAVPGMGPIEVQGVVDVGSFDVGLDRPEQVSIPPEPQQVGEMGMPAGPEEVQPVPEAPAEPPATSQPAAPPGTPAEQAGVEKSRVEDREKDFFGFETEGPEAAGEDVFLADAVEEITFEMEEPVDESGGDKMEASFIVPEAAEDGISVTGETISPEALAPEPPAPEPPAPGPAYPEPPVLEEQPLSLQQPFLEEEEAPGEFAASIEGQDIVPEMGDAAPPVGSVPEEFVPEPAPPMGSFVPGAEAAGAMPGEPVFEAPAEPAAPEPEPPMQAQKPDDLMPPAQVPEKMAGDMAQGLSEAEVRKIVEEKVEKIVWEVVPEMAEVLIREAIEKIKGKP